MPSLGLLSSLSNSVSALSSYVRDGLKLYMPYTSPKEVKFVGQGSTAFDGSNDYIVCGHDPTLDVGTSDFTACCWFKVIDDGAHYDIISKGTSLGSGYGWALAFAYTDTKLWFDCGDGSTRVTTLSASTISYNTWYHVAITRDNEGDLSKIYLNGVEDVSTANTLNDLGDGTQSIPFEIGSSVDNRFLNGSVKNVGFWNRVLSPTEIQNAMYKSYSDLSSTLTSGLVSWWSLEKDDVFTDLKGSNNGTGTSLDASDITDSLYGGATPLIPRGVDNAPVAQADAIGTGYASFDSSESNYIDCGSDSSLDVGSSDFSACCWFKIEDDSSHHDIMGKCNSSLSGSPEGWSVAYYANEKDIRFEVGETSGKDDAISNAISDGRWYHVAVTRDNSGNSMKIYIDGVLHQEEASHTAGYLDDSDRSFKIGGSARPLEGNVKNVGFWKGTILTQPQIQSIMEKTYSELTSSEKTNLVSWWGLDSTTLGSELVDSGDFSSAGDWIEAGNTWAIANGKCTHTSGANDNVQIRQDSILTSGKTYRVSYDIVDYTSGNVRIDCGDTGAGIGTDRSAIGSYSEDLVATGVFLDIEPRGTGGATFIGAVDNVSVKEVQAEDEHGSNNGSLI